MQKGMEIVIFYLLEKYDQLKKKKNVTGTSTNLFELFYHGRSFELASNAVNIRIYKLILNIKT